MSKLTQIEAGDTLTVTLRVNGTESGGQLTVTDVKFGGDHLKVENGDGTEFTVILHDGDDHVIGRGGTELGTVHDIEVA